jgi:hypothetical protein
LGCELSVQVALEALPSYGDSVAWAELTRAGERMLNVLAEEEMHSAPCMVGEFATLADPSAWRLTPPWSSALR